MSSNFAFEFYADASSLHKAQEKSAANNDKLTQSAKAAAKAARELERFAKQAAESVKTPQEKHIERTKKLDAAYRAGHLSVKQYNLALAQSRQELASAGKANNSVFGSQAVSMAKQLAGALGLTGGVAGAVALVRAELNDLWETQKQIRDASLTVADAQIKAFRNLGADSPEDRDAFVDKIKSMSDRTGISQRDLYLLASDALSARGDLSVDKAMEAVEAAAKLAPEDASVARALAGSALDIMKETGGEASAEQSVGFLQEVVSRSRVKDTGKVAKEFTPVFGRAMAAGGDFETTAALFAAITHGAKDEEGAVSRTAAINYIDKVQEYFRTEEGDDISEFSAARRKAVESGVTAFPDQLRFLQQNDDINAEFVADLSGFRAQTKESVRGLTKGKGVTADSYAAFAANMPGVMESGDTYRTQVDLIHSAPLQAVADLDRAGKAYNDALAVSQITDAQLASVKEQGDALLAKSGMGAFARNMGQIGTWSRTNEDAMLDRAALLRRRAREIDVRVEASTYGQGSRVIDIENTPAEESQMAALRAYADLIERQVEAVQENTAEMRAQRERASAGETTLGSPDAD